MKKIVTLIPSATEIVAFLGMKDSIVGRSHECDYPKELNKIIKLTSPKINVDGTSGQIHKQINTILENSLSVYKVDVNELRKLEPDIIITQAHCEVCAVSLSEVEKIVVKHLNEKTKIISLQPNSLDEVFSDIKKVGNGLSINEKTVNNLIKPLEERIKNIKDISQRQKKITTACVEWMDPLMAAGNWIPEMVEISGGEDIFGKSGKDSHWINFDEIKNYDPEIIIFLPCGYDIKKTTKELENLLIIDNKWKNLSAFKNKQFYVVDGNQFFNRPGPRLMESLEIFAEIIHPKLFNFNHHQSGWINFFNKYS
jgi:iron complex transport system substrate-binding protein